MILFEIIVILYYRHVSFVTKWLILTLIIILGRGINSRGRFNDE